MDKNKKIAIITGAARGLGENLAYRLAAEAYAVVVADINYEGAQKVAKAIEEIHGHKSLPVKVDVSRPEEIEAMVCETVEAFGRLDIMIANAGICHASRMEDITEEKWDTTMDINAKGVFFSARAAARQMIAQGQGGKIINASSIAGRQGFAFISHYCASKFAIIGITQSLALELAPYRITVNAYCPGIADTPLWKDLDREYARIRDIPVGQQYKEYIEGIPIGRVQEPDDVSDLVSFLASEQSNYITGQSIVSDGGLVMR